MTLEFLGGSMDGMKRDISEDMDDPRVMTITYKTDKEIYVVKKFHGEYVLYYQGKLKK